MSRENYAVEMIQRDLAPYFIADEQQEEYKEGKHGAYDVIVDDPTGIKKLRFNEGNNYTLYIDDFDENCEMTLLFPSSTVVIPPYKEKNSKIKVVAKRVIFGADKIEKPDLLAALMMTKSGMSRHVLQAIEELAIDAPLATATYHGLDIVAREVLPIGDRIILANSSIEASHWLPTDTDVVLLTSMEMIETGKAYTKQS